MQPHYHFFTTVDGGAVARYRKVDERPDSTVAVLNYEDESRPHNMGAYGPKAGYVAACGYCWLGIAHSDRLHTHTLATRPTEPVTETWRL